MKRFGVSYIVRNAFFISSIAFLAIFFAVYLVMDFLYNSFQGRTKEVLEITARAFKNDFYDWILIGVDTYGEQVLKEKIDEYRFFDNVVKKNLVSSVEDYIGEEGKGIFLASSFYYDGKKIFSDDPNYTEDKSLLSFLKKLNLKPGSKSFYRSEDTARIVYVQKLEKGILGATVYPERYVKSWLKSMLLGAPINLYLSFTKKNENPKFAKIIKEVDDNGINFDEMYNKAKSKAVGESLNILSGLHGDMLTFVVIQNYGEYMFNSIIAIPVRNVFPLMAWELSFLINLPIAVLTFILVIIKTRKLQEAYNELEEKDRIIQMELDFASLIQRNIMPKGRYKWGDFYIYGYSQPMEKIGGDFFDVIAMPGGKLLFYVADVSGHGIPAALITTMLKVSLIAIALEERDPSKILSKLNERIRIVNSSEGQVIANYLTIFIGVLDKNGDMFFSSGGHYVPVVYNSIAKKFKEMKDINGPIVGILEPSLFRTTSESFRVERGDKIILFTDGIVERRNPEGKHLEIDGFKHIIVSAIEKGFSGKELVAFVLNEIEKFSKGVRARDDYTLLLVERIQ